MKQNHLISDEWNGEKIEDEKNFGLTELDSVYAAMVIKQLKSGWPFKPKNVNNKFIQTYQPKNYLEDFAFKILSKTAGKNYNLEAAHMDLGRYYENKNELNKAYQEYNALVTSIPTEIEFYNKAAQVLLKEKEYDTAESVLKKSLKYKDNFYAYKWIGQIELMNENYKDIDKLPIKS